MLYTRNAFYFRKFYKEEVAKEKYPIDLNFIGSTAPNKNNDGFSKLIYGNREDIGKLLSTIALNVAADDQAIYELIQNADDCKSSFFSVNYNEKYLLCINNGNYFSDLDMSAIINVAGNYKDGEDIGTFGIGFKILHRLVGADDGREAIINDYAGPIIFSWNNYFQLKKFIEGEPIYVSGIGKAKENYDYERDRKNPWLVKLLYTCFPSNYKEPVRLGDYETRDVKFDEIELSEMREFLSGSLQNVNLAEDNYLKNGSIFFLRLGEGKSKFLDEGIDKIKSGLSYSFKFLNSLNKIYINGDEIKAQSVLDYSHSFPINSQEFKDINPKNKNRDIKFTFAFYRDYKMAVDLQNELAPNLYTFFSMDEEKNGFSFLLHCNAFDMNNDRRKLQANSQINEKLLPIIAKSIIAYANTQKENNRNLFLSLYGNFLLSKSPKNKPHIDNNFFKFIHQYILENIPTKNGVSDKPENVKINKLQLNLDLSEFGLNDIQWFKWNNEADILLIEEAKKAEKLNIEEWDIRDIIENADLESINNWISTCDNNTYRAFLKELEESYLRKETKERICQIKFFRFSNGEYYSINDVIKKVRSPQSTQYRTIYNFNYNFSNAFFKMTKTEGIIDELDKIGIILSEISTSEYPNIFSSIERMPDEKQMYTFIADKCKTNTLSAKEKKKLFLNFINEATKFDNVADGTLKDLHLFCDSNSEIKPLCKLIGNIKTPSWLKVYKIKQDEHFPELNPYLISESEEIFKNIYQLNQADIIAELTTAEEVKSLIKLYQDNQKPFFKEFIIKKESNGFVIDEKRNETYQVQSADKEARKFLDENCSDNLFVLPFEFVEKFKDEDGIIKADDLHSLILEFVDADEHKETLVDIVKYKAKHKFLQELSEFRFNSETKYSKEDFEYKILDLACSELKENDYQKFKDKVVIETENQDLKLTEIPPFTDKIKIDEYEISLAKILPDNYENSDHLSSLINQFIGLGLNKERIGILFGISEEPEPSDIFQMFSEQVETLENAEQLAFLFIYGLYIETIDFNQFKALNVNEEEIELGTDKYLTDFDFIQHSEILHQKYRGITKIFKDFPIVIEDNDNLLLIKEPYFEDDKFICPYIEEDLSDEQKLSFVEFLFNQWNKKSNKIAIQNIDWSKIDDVETDNILGFNPRISVYPSKYACESELLPDYLIKWMGKEETKIDFFSDLGVWTENSVVVELRKYLSNKIKDFHNNRLAQETRFNDDEANLFNSFVWLKEKEITLKTAEQFETFKKAVDVINENRTNTGEIEIKEEFDFEELEENATEWEESYYENWKEDSDVAIYLYEGELPKTISLDEIDDFVFYYFYEGNTAIDDKNIIYVNRNADVKKGLRKLELENEDFNFDGLWQNKLDVLEKENAKLRRANEATLGTEYSTDISKNDQKEANREAKEIVKEKLEREGFEFTDGIGKYSTIDGVFKDEIEFPLVVKSYKYQDEPLKIGANEWIQLMKPNSMFWLHFGNRKLGCLKLYELLRNQDKLTISFSTENLDVEDRLEKFAELLHYFGNVHFDFNSVKPSDYSVAKDLSDYRFDERRNEEDLSGDDESIL
ncbi:MAG: hypothetical protein PHF92_07040 [Bacteroidales bacterium]|nr:hypothetical protein [Bacteroidales bacterium]